MTTSSSLAAQYWGYLIKPDKTPSPVFEQLLLGVANYINKHVAPWDNHSLTPAKLATFYRLVGGDYDPLFLDTPQASLSFIYQSLGCFHTLQPEKDPYTAPTIPALTPQGFVRWQTVQLLLEPEEHVPFLQAAVKRFDLVNPADGEPFPSILPREALPTKPDLELTEWHDSVSEKLMLEAQASQFRNMPPRPPMALSDAEHGSSRPSSVDSHSIDSQSIVDAAGYFSLPRVQVNGRPSHVVHVPLKTRAAPNLPPPYDAPWSPERRRSSLPDNRTHNYPASWPCDKAAPTAFPQAPARQQLHARTSSSLSTSSYTSDSSFTDSSASLSPVRHHAQPHVAIPATMDRRHSAHFSPQRPPSHPNGVLAHQRQPYGPSKASVKGMNVRWHDTDSGFDTPRQSGPSSADRYNWNGRGARSVDIRGARDGDEKGAKEREDRARGARSVDSMTGVGGRRYATGGTGWR